MERTRSVCVYCGSRAGHDPAYLAAAEELGLLIAGEGWRLVYGAGDIGIMGRTAAAAQGAGATALGVIPVHLQSREVARESLTMLIVTENMHERKKVMFMNADAIVVLPGGAGTLDEFFEVLTWKQIGLHRKPIFLVDAGGFWGPLVALIDHVIASGFAEPSLRDLITVVPDVATLGPRLRGALG
ncbi:MAG: TIGR00730 family Rossman fold protein [Gemmobacter sp.]|jgi:uncharacterized protein (TIGR00730 family)